MKAASLSGSVTGYLPIIIPGILAQTALTASMATGVQLREDMDKGVFYHFKVMPKVMGFLARDGPR